jgi:hypothetical protein
MRFHCLPSSFKSLSITDFERACAGFTILISVVAQKDVKVCLIRMFAFRGLAPNMSGLKPRDKARNGREGRAVSPGENGGDIFFGPPTAPNSFKRALNSLHDLMELIPPEAPVCRLLESIRDFSVAI